MFLDSWKEYTDEKKDDWILQIIIIYQALEPQLQNTMCVNIATYTATAILISNCTEMFLVWELVPVEFMLSLRM